MKLEQKVYEVIPPGRYDAKLIEVKAEDSQYGGQYLKMTFQVEDPAYQDVNVTACANALFSTRSKLYKWAKALFSKPIPKSYVLDTADLLGRRCQLGVEVVQDGDDEFNRVESIYPIRESRAAEAAAPTAPMQDDAPWPDQPPAGLKEKSEEIPW